MADAVVQAVKGVETIGITASCTVTAITAGSTVVAILEHSAGFLGAPAVTGPAGFTYCGTQAFEPNKASVDIWYKDNESGGQTSYSASGPNNVSKILFIVELSGMALASSNDVNENFVGSTVANMGVGGFVQEGQAHEIVIAGFSTNINNIASTGFGTFTGSVENHNTDGSYLVTYYVNSGGGAVSQAANNTVGSLYSYAAKLATFREAPKAIQNMPITNTGVVSLTKAKLVFKTLNVLGTRVLHMSKLIKKNFLVKPPVFIPAINPAHLTAVKIKFLSIPVLSSQLMNIYKRYPKELVVAGAGIASMIRTRVRNLFVAGTHIEQLSKVREQFLTVIGTGVTNFSVLIKKTLAVIGTGISKTQIALFKKLLVVGTGIANVLRLRFHFIRVAGAGIVNISFIRNILLTVLGNGLANLNEYRILHRVLKALNTQGKVNISRSMTKHMTVTGSQSIVIKVPRLLKKTLAVTGSKILSFLHLHGTNTAVGVVYNIEVVDQDKFNIGVE